MGLGKIVAVAGITKGREVQNNIKFHQDRLIKQNKKLFNKLSETSEDAYSDIYEKVNKLIDQELIHVQELDQSIKNYKSSLHFRITSHKLKQISEGVKEILANENHGYMLIEGKLPPEYNNEVEHLTILGNSEYYGSSNPTLISAALMYINIVLNREFNPQYDISNYSLDKSSIIHLVPTPSDFTLPKDSVWSYDNGNYPGIIIPDSGYGFGGSRNVPEKYKGPWDCTSLIEDIVKPEVITTTGDLMCVWSVANNKFKPTNWLDSASGPAINLYKPIDLERIEPGNIIFSRTFQLGKNVDDSIGIAPAHAFIFLEYQGSVASTIAANRDAPSKEGVGLEINSLQSRNKKNGNQQKIFALESIHEPDIVQQQPIIKEWAEEFNVSNISDLLNKIDDYHNSQLIAYYQNLGQTIDVY